jgi:hypothetical protein
MRCRECGDLAHYYVKDKIRGLMPWYYCLSCVCLFEKLEHIADFRSLQWHNTNR